MNIDLSDPLIKSVVMPGLVGAAGTGALSAYMTSKQKPNETGEQRRKRVMRNAVLGASLGGGAAAALPSGVKMLAQPFSGPGGGLVGSGMDTAVDLVSDNAAGLGALGVGGYAAHRAVQDDRGRAAQTVLDLLQDTTIGDKPVRSANDLRALASTPEGYQSLVSSLSQRLEGAGPAPAQNALAKALGVSVDRASSGMNPMLSAAELLGQSGGPMPKWETLKKMVNTGTSPLDKSLSEVTMRQALTGHLAAGPSQTGKLMSWLLGKEKLPFADKAMSYSMNHPDKPVGKLLGRYANTIPKGELLHQYWSKFRPTAQRMTGATMSPLSMAGMVGGGALLANHLQNKVMGEA